MSPLAPVAVALGALLVGELGALAWARRRRRELELQICEAARAREEAGPSAAIEPATSPLREPITPPSAPLPGWVEGVLEAAVPTRYSGYSLQDTGSRGALVTAWDRQLERKVDLRVPPPHLSTAPRFRELFLREARVLAGLDHPSLIKVYDVPEVPEGETPVLVLEHLDGDDLIGAAGDPERVLLWLEQVASALDHMHEREVLHRNVQPSTVIVGADEVARLTDLGFASVKDASSLTGIGITFGDPAYLAPDQLRGAPGDAAGDRYALAAVAYRVLYGHPPFDPEDRVRTQPPHQALQAALPEAVDALFARALAPDAGDRPTTACGFVAGLRTAMEGA